MITFGICPLLSCGGTCQNVYSGERGVARKVGLGTLPLVDLL